ncbi:MAG: hypothetical protein ACUVRV_09670 [Cyanobacteriota bacterium]
MKAVEGSDLVVLRDPSEKEQHQQAGSQPQWRLGFATEIHRNPDSGRPGGTA